MPPLALLDANVLYPAPLRDTLLWLSYLGVIRAHWTAAIHEEWIRNVAANQGIDRRLLDKTRRLMDAHADDALVTDYEQFEALFSATDPKDRHVAAAALRVSKDNRGRPVKVVTWNTRHFRTDELRAYALSKENPNAFLCGLFEAAPDDVLQALKRQRANLQRPPQSADDLLATLGHQKLAGFVRLVTPRKGRI